MKTTGICFAVLVMSFSGGLALEKERSLLTGEPMGELAVAGRLSVDLHAEFMLSRAGNGRALNWYNCGYSGGGRGGSSVGGNFGDFGFQVPYAERERKYPRAVALGEVPAVAFDGGNFLVSNIPLEPKMLESRTMSIELWLRVGASNSTSEAVLGWQSVDGTKSSAALQVPRGLSSGAWHHLVVVCRASQEHWYLDGRKLGSMARRLKPEAGNVMVLGGESAAKPSFKGELAAVRLHDEELTDQEVLHNFQGGVMLGTEIHHWWRTEPDKWWTQNSKHFRHCVDRAEMQGWSSQQLKGFEGRVPGMFDLAELVYHVYSESLAMRSSVVSVRPEERGDGIKYSIPIQPAPGCFMGWDGHFGWSCQGAGFINPHELVHGWQGMTGGMAGQYWEAHANFPQTYVGIYQTIPLTIRETSLFPANGRTYYHDRGMFEHLAQIPEYGPMFISKLWYDGWSNENKAPYPWHTFERLNPYPERTLADEWVRMAMRNVTGDYQTFEECKSPADYAQGPRVRKENLYRRVLEEEKNQAHQLLLRWRVKLEPVAYLPGWWRVPKTQAPQQLGYNICPLSCKPGTVWARLEGYVNPERGGDWRAGFVAVDAKGEPTYSKPFRAGEQGSFQVGTEARELYLVVCATPTKILEIPMTGDFRSFEQEQFPYRVQLTGCEPAETLPDLAAPQGRKHANGGGLVANGAEVDASAFVGPEARVLEGAKVLGKARIEDKAVVRNATVQDEAVVSGNALVSDGAVISGHAKVRDYAVIKENSSLGGSAKVIEHAVLSSRKTCSDSVVVKGNAFVYGGNQSGSAMIDGFYAKANEITGGKWFTWSWGMGKNPGEEEGKFGGLYADYEFNEPHAWMARDSFGATWGYLVNGAKVEPGSADKGVLRLNGTNQFVELPKDLADLAEATYTAEFSWDGNTPGGRIFEFGNVSGDFFCLTPSYKGQLMAALRKGSVLEVLSAPAVPARVWTTVQVMFSGGSASLYVNGKLAQKKRVTLRPESIEATECYLGRGLKGDYFGGAIGRFTVHSAALVDESAPTPNPPAFELAPLWAAPETLVMIAKRGSDPLDVVEYWFEELNGRWNSGWLSEPRVRLHSKNPGAAYRIKMRDKAGNQTAYSQPLRATGPRLQSVIPVASDKAVSFEAEDFIQATPSQDGGSEWQLQKEPQGFTGKGVMAVPDRGARNEPFSIAGARLDYALNFQKAGRYYLWVRANGNNDGGQSIYVGLGMNGSEEDKMVTGFGKYAWKRSRELQVKGPGVYLLSVWMREDGAMLDRFEVTGSESYQPAP